MTDTDARIPAAAARIPSPRTQTVAIVTAGAGQNIIYTVVTTFMLLYLLQYADFEPAQIAIATTVIAVARIVDAIGDPIVGSLIDMTRTRWGKLRPFILFSAVPVAVLTDAAVRGPRHRRAGAVYFARLLRHLGLRLHVLRRAALGAHRLGVPRPGRRNRVVGFVRAFGAISLGLATLGLPPLARALSFAPRDHRRAAGRARSRSSRSSGWACTCWRSSSSASATARRRSKRLTFRELFGALFRNTPLLMVLLGSVLGFGRFIVQAGGAVFAVIAYDDEGLFTLLGAGIIAGLVVASFIDAAAAAALVVAHAGHRVRHRRRRWSRC